MYEIEVKLAADHGPVRDRLRDLGAEPLGTVVQADVYYDHPGRSFAETDEAVRLREETDDGGASSASLTYKGPLVEAESKTREELESTVGDPAAVRGILEALGFQPAGEVRKERARFALEGFDVVLDRVEGLGEFVEVETEGTADDIEERRDDASALLDRLGLDPEDQMRTAYLSLLRDDVGE